MLHVKKKLTYDLLMIVTFVNFLTAYANPFDNNTNYFKYIENGQFSFYIETDSVGPTYYDPPIYGIRDKEVVWSDNIDDSYGVYSNTYLYNFDTKVVIRILDEMEFYSKSSGDFQKKLQVGDKSEVPLNSIAAFAADYLFLKCYGIHFYN